MGNKLAANGAPPVAYVAVKGAVARWPGLPAARHRDCGQALAQVAMGMSFCLILRMRSTAAQFNFALPIRADGGTLVI